MAIDSIRGSEAQSPNSVAKQSQALSDTTRNRRADDQEKERVQKQEADEAAKVTLSSAQQKRDADRARAAAQDESVTYDRKGKTVSQESRVATQVNKRAE